MKSIVYKLCRAILEYSLLNTTQYTLGILTTTTNSMHKIKHHTLTSVSKSSILHCYHTTIIIKVKMLFFL